MAAGRFFLFEKRTCLYGLLLFMLVSIICLAFTIKNDDAFDLARREVLLRRVGHEILLQSGDSITRVLPIKKISADEYQVSFEHALSFTPELLVNTTQRLLANQPFVQDYIVNVLNCADASIAYSYAISKNNKKDIVACKGRQQPTGCYIIHFKFKPAGILTAYSSYLLVALFFLAVIGFVFVRRRTQQKNIRDIEMPGSADTGLLKLGAMVFDTASRKLMMQENTIELTKTEARVLQIFALSPNEAIERSRLQKEIWEDEGVIVGRSLDMFISKLRKKLESDPNVNIVVIRGKGYKLETNA
jgi:hypothetical protein